MIKPIVAIHQPNYFPWLGYFLKMSLCDIFIMHDNVQLNPRSYTRRCKIQGQSDVLMLSIPLVKVSQSTVISEVLISDAENWRTKHLKTIKHTYSKSTQFNAIYPLLEAELLNLDSVSHLVAVNRTLIRWIASLLDINPSIQCSSELSVCHDGSTDHHHLALINALEGRTYLSGLGAKAYQDDQLYNTNKINLHYVESYKLLSNVFPNEEVGLSCIDLLMRYPIEEIRDRLKSIELPPS